ncbi:MAG: hypothetical protein EZS28_038437 [Streblomastix strix]|uniref:Uncharacterized protein n=1 Tax=Streblomastix strix TaxID=222440 RepID=A0A5J4U8L1_9EUKA|nr:MAG: hypothetical protein EZS28_038437 [Streblomastix strix]
MILYGQRFNTQKRYYFAKEKLKKWTKINHYTLFDLLAMKPHISITEVLAQFTSVNTSASSALQFIDRLSSMLSLTFDIDLKNNHKLQIIMKAILVHMIVNRYIKTHGTWEYYLTIGDKKPAEIEGIPLRHSVICEQTDKEDL